MIFVRSDVREWMLSLLQHVGGPWDGYQTHALAGGRGGTLVVQPPAHEAVVVRPCRRGGLPARILHEVYLGWRPRPLRELRALASLRQAGAPVAEAYGAVVQWLGPVWYRGWLVTRYIPAARNFWDWVGALPSEPERQIVLRQIGKSIRRLHDCGGSHPDLNLQNILVCPQASSVPEIVLIDFDRARVPGKGRRSGRRELARLERSARKLDPQGTRVTTADLELLRLAYNEVGS